MENVIKDCRFFLSYTDEENWLNKMNQSGLLLFSKTGGAYIFKDSEGKKVVYTVECFNSLAKDNLTDEYVREKQQNNQTIVAYYKKRVYLASDIESYKSADEIYELRTVAMKTRVRTVLSYLMLFLLPFLTFTGLMCYYSVLSYSLPFKDSSVTMSAYASSHTFYNFFDKIGKFLNFDKLFGDTMTTLTTTLSFIVIIILAIPTAVYLLEMLTMLFVKHKPCLFLSKITPDTKEEKE